MDKYRLRNWLRLLRKIVLAFGVILSFFATLEILRAYQTLYFFHPYVGYAFLATIICSVIGLVGYFVLAIMKHPPVLKPPPIVDRDNPSLDELQEQGKYIVKYAQRLVENEHLSNVAQESLLAGVPLLESASQTADRAKLTEALDNAEEHLKPAIFELDEIAEKHIRDCVRDVSVIVALSPWHAIDLLVVIYRNYGMVLRIIRTYNSRPRYSEVMMVMNDTWRVVSHVNYTNFFAKLIETLSKSIPQIGPYIAPYADEVAQGAGAGLFTSMAGHAAIDRCKALRGWEQEEAVRGITVHARNYMKDIRGMITKDLLPKMKSRIRRSIPKEEIGQEEEILKQFGSGVSDALDETAEYAESFVDKPVPVIRTKVAPASTWVGRTGTRIVSASTVVRRTAVKSGKVSLRGISKGAGFVASSVGALQRKRKERKQKKK